MFAPNGLVTPAIGVVHLPVMRIYQRGGQNWGFSYGLGPLLLIGVFALGAVVTAFQHAWFVLVPALVTWGVLAIVQWVRRDREMQASCDFHDAEHVDGVWDEGCHWCELENMELELRERQQDAAERARAGRERLRAKYRT